MKRIAFVVNTLSSGGAERAVSNLSMALADRYDIDLILNDSVNITYPYSGNVISLGMPGSADRMKPEYQIFALMKRTALLRRLKRERGYTAVISFSGNTGLSNVLSGRRHSRNIVSVRNSLSGKEAADHRKYPLRRLRLRLYTGLSDVVVSCSKEIAEELAEHYTKDRGKIKVIYNGTDTEKIRAQIKNDTRQKAAESTDRTYRLISTGRLTKQKAQWHLLYALKELHDRGIPCSLTILGEGGLRTQLEDLCKRLGIEDVVSMPGWVPDPYDEVAKADAAVFTSDHEGFSNALIEALACGVPCISTDHRTGAREILAPDTEPKDKVRDHIEFAEYGILVPVCSGDMSGPETKTGKAGDVRKATAEELLLADAIQALLDDKEMASRYKEAGRSRAEALSIEKAAGQWIKVIEE